MHGKMDIPRKPMVGKAWEIEVLLKTHGKTRDMRHGKTGLFQIPMKRGSKRSMGSSV